MKKIKLFEEFIAEVRTNQTSGTKAGWITSLEDRKYELKKPVKGVKIGSFTNQTLPKGTIIHNLPGGVFAMHPELEDKFKLTYSSQAPRWNYTFGVLVTSLPETLEAIEKNGKVLESQNISEKREDVGKYNTVKKVIAKLGRRPSEQELAQFITDNYYDVTEVERGEDDPSANDKIADLVAFYKFDIDDWEIAWFDAQNESVVTEAKLKISGPAYDLWDDRDVQRKLKGVKIKIVGDIGGVATISGADDEIQKVKDILGLNESVVTEAKDNLYLQLHKKYAEQIKGLKAKKIKKLTDLVSVQRWSMEDREDYFDMDSKKKKELSAEYNEERKLFKKYVAGDESVMLPKGTEELAESVVNEEAVEVTPDSKVVVDDYLLDDAETEIKSAEIIGAIVSANSEDEFLDYFYKEYGNGAFTESDISKLIAYYQDYREEVNAAETEAEEEAEGGDEKDPLADLGI